MSPGTETGTVLKTKLDKADGAEDTDKEDMRWFSTEMIVALGYTEPT